LIAAGTPAPDFKVRDHSGRDVSLADFQGRKLVLAFYPLDFSPACSDQLSIYQEVLGEIEAHEAQLAGVSVDSSWCHRAFRKHLGLSFPLLADFNPKGDMSRAFGAYLEDRGTSNRSLVLIDEAGTVRWVYEAPSTADIPGANLIFDALAG
jgi:peroxiredoxin